jgi:SanA protein
MADARPVVRGRLARWWLFVPAVVSCVLALVLGNVYVVETTAHDIVANVADAPARPVAIVLGNMVLPDGRLPWALESRVTTALQLYRAGKVQRLFLSGAANLDVGYDEPGSMARWLEARGVPRSAMILDRLGHRTAATMANAASQGIRDALVCTQAYHLPRALYFARHAGISATGVTSAPHGERMRVFFREGLARPSAILEVAVRGVTAD